MEQLESSLRGGWSSMEQAEADWSRSKLVQVQHAKNTKLLVMVLKVSAPPVNGGRKQ